MAFGNVSLIFSTENTSNACYSIQRTYFGGGKMTIENDSLLNEFKAGLSKMRFEILKELHQTNVLDKEKFEHVLDLINQNLIVRQHEFIKMVAQVKGQLSGEPTSVDLKGDTKNKKSIEEVVAAVGGAGLGAAGATFLGWTTPGIFYSTSTTVASTIASVLGVTVGVATAGAAVVGGLGAGYIANKLMRSRRIKKIKNEFMDQWDKSVEEDLLPWAEKVIHEVDQS
ncbi:MAG: hypothetical protein ABGW78_10890 [Pirellulales bacterium]